MSRLHIFVIAILCLLIFGCQNNNSNKVEQEIMELKETINSIQTDLNNTKLDLTFLKIQIEGLEDGGASFTPSSKGFNKVNTSVGAFFVSLENIKKYANGYKVTFRIGNPNAVTYTDMNAKITWGKEYQKDANIIEWQKSLRNMVVEINKSILPMTWNVVTFTLSPANSTDIGYIGISLIPSHVILQKDFRAPEVE